MRKTAYKAYGSTFVIGNQISESTISGMASPYHIRSPDATCADIMSVSVIRAACTTAGHRILHDLRAYIKMDPPFGSGSLSSHAHIYYIDIIVLSVDMLSDICCVVFLPIKYALTVQGFSFAVRGY